MFWTNDVHYAVNRAGLKSFPENGLPVILAARLRDVCASGQPIADLNAWEINRDRDPEFFPSDFLSSLFLLSTMAVLGCRKVENLHVFVPGRIDFLPNAKEAFQRAIDYWPSRWECRTKENRATPSP